MTQQQIAAMQNYLTLQLTPIVTRNNPGASADEVTAYVQSLVGFYTGFILPNLQVQDVNGNVVANLVFVVPSGS